MKTNPAIVAAAGLLALTACSTAEDAQACELMEAPNEAYEEALAAGSILDLIEADSLAHTSSAEALELEIEDEGLAGMLQEIHSGSGVAEGTDPNEADGAGTMNLVAETVEHCSDRELQS